jgi:hypothetical protein
MTGAARDPGTSANFRYTTSTDLTCTAHLSKGATTLSGQAPRRCIDRLDRPESKVVASDQVAGNADEMGFTLLHPLAGRPQNRFCVALRFMLDATDLAIGCDAA